MVAKKTNNPFLGRTLAVPDDFTLDEQKYLLFETKKLKKAILNRDREIYTPFQIDDPLFGIYTAFLESSTRTKESFTNAACFHNVKLNDFDSSKSSMNKSESFPDTFNTLIGYHNDIVIVRSKQEGLCRWLEKAGHEYAKRNGLNRSPAFINGGDGKHAHPTQKDLDIFTFAEYLNWNLDYIHIALIGDLVHGRTVHSLTEGLRIFDNVKVDLIAPPEISMPEKYVQKMKDGDFEVRSFESIDEYISIKGKKALQWYFTRLQLERMGSDVLEKAPKLRKAITIDDHVLDKITEGTAFYHPRPRHEKYPTIPISLDSTSLNHWERQSDNGYFVRAVLIGAIGGAPNFDNGFDGEILQKREFVDDFFYDVEIKHENLEEKNISEGVNPISNGIVIDSIGRYETYDEIKAYTDLIVNQLRINDGKGGEWRSESKKQTGATKGLIFRPYKNLSESQIKMLGAIEPSATLNIIEKSQVIRKIKFNKPPRIYGFDLRCMNENCVASPNEGHVAPAEFHRVNNKGIYSCMYCDTDHTIKEIWTPKLLKQKTI
jgi:aspartate carbamoyltransferase